MTRILLALILLLAVPTQAEEVVAETRSYLASGAPVGEHLADQLLMPMTLAGGAFRAGPLSMHTKTNVEVLRLFLGEEAVSVDEAESGSLLDRSSASSLQPSPSLSQVNGLVRFAAVNSSRLEIVSWSTSSR